MHRKMIKSTVRTCRFESCINTPLKQHCGQLKHYPPLYSSSQFLYTTALMTQLQGRKLLLRFYSSSHMSTQSRQLQKHNMTWSTFIYFIFFICADGAAAATAASVLLNGSPAEQRRGDGPICSLINRWNANDPDSSCRLKCRGEGGMAAFVGVGRLCWSLY